MAVTVAVVEAELGALTSEVANALNTLRRLADPADAGGIKAQLAQYKAIIDGVEAVVARGAAVDAFGAGDATKFEQVEHEIAACEALVEQLQQVRTECTVLRDLRTEVGTEQEEVCGDISECIDDCSSTFTDRVASIETKSREAVDAAIAAIDEMISDVDAEITQTADDVEDSLSAGSEEFTADVTEKLEESLGNLGQTAEEVSTGLQDLCDSVGDIFGSLGKAYGDLGGDLNEASGALQVVSDILNDIQATLETIS